MAPPPHEWHMSVEEYLKLDRDSPQARYEYIDGRVRMLAGGTPDHAKISANIIGVLYGLLEESGCSIYTSDVRVRVSATRYVYPDVAVSCEEEDQEWGEMIQHPCLIVEVLSHSTEAIDRGEKLACYRDCPSVREYVLVDTRQQAVEVFRRETHSIWTYRAFRAGDQVEFGSLDVRFPIAKIYRNVVFDNS
jgi:Uma2 family endonuclease